MDINSLKLLHYTLRKQHSINVHNHSKLLFVYTTPFYCRTLYNLQHMGLIHDFVVSPILNIHNIRSHTGTEIDLNHAEYRRINWVVNLKQNDTAALYVYDTCAFRLRFSHYYWAIHTFVYPSHVSTLLHQEEYYEPKLY